MSRKQAGFTIVEAMVVVAVVGIMSALSLAALDKLRRSQDLAGNLHTLAAHVGHARMQAMRRGFPVMLLAYVPPPDVTKDCPPVAFPGTTSWRKCVRYYLIVDKGGAGSQLSADLTSTGPLPGLNPDSLATHDADSDDDFVLERAVWGPSAVPLASGAASPPEPYDSIPTTSACSFCTLTASGGTPMGAVVFNPDGTVTMTGGSSRGGSMSFRSSRKTGENTGGDRTFVITAPLGLSRVF